MRGAEVPWRTKTWRVSSRSAGFGLPPQTARRVRRTWPVIGGGGPTGLHAGAWDGRVRPSSVGISREVEVAKACAVTVSRPAHLISAPSHQSGVGLGGLV